MTLMVNTMVTGLVSCSIFNWTSSITAVVQDRRKVHKFRGGGGHSMMVVTTESQYIELVDLQPLALCMVSIQEQFLIKSGL